MPPPSTESPRKSLQSAGLRITGPRLMVLTRLQERPHSTADQLLEWVESQPGAISRQGVYDVLASLEEVGLARRIEPAGHASRYETRVDDNHHHVICRSCGAIEDVDCVQGAMPCLQPSARAGFTVDEAEVNFWGLCPECQNPPKS